MEKLLEELSADMKLFDIDPSKRKFLEGMIEVAYMTGRVDANSKTLDSALSHSQ